MSKRPDQLVVREDWFPQPHSPSAPAAWSSLLGMAIGLAIGTAVFTYHSRVFGASVIVLALIIGVAGATSPGRRQFLAVWFGKLGHLVGTIVAFLILTPLFFLGFTAARIMSRISGNDPLQLRTRNRRTFWWACDTQQRKSRHARAMFVTEPRVARNRWSWLSLALLATALLISGELILRAFGFGHAVLYTPDDMAGLIPAANQDVYRLGGRVITNEFGMRAPRYTRDKPLGALRILMLGDSTLYGGQYVTQDRLYARLLEAKLRRMRPHREIQVLNMGVNGWGPFNKLGFVQKFGTFQADLCVICLPVDDFRRPKIHIWDTPYFRSSAPPRLAYEEVLYHLNWRRRTRSQRVSSEERARQIERGVAAYLELIELLRASGCEVLVEVLPSRLAGTSSTVPAAEQQLWERFQRQLRGVGVEASFPVGLFAGRGEIDELYHDNVHLHVLGHELYADHLVQSIANSVAWRTDEGQSSDRSEKAGDVK